MALAKILNKESNTLATLQKEFGSSTIIYVNHRHRYIFSKFPIVVFDIFIFECCQNKIEFQVQCHTIIVMLITIVPVFIIIENGKQIYVIVR